MAAGAEEIVVVVVMMMGGTASVIAGTRRDSALDRNSSTLLEKECRLSG